MLNRGDSTATLLVMQADPATCHLDALPSAQTLNSYGRVLEQEK